MVNLLQRELLKWNNFIRLNPKQSQAYVRRGMVKFQLARVEASIRDFDRAEQLDPSITPYLWQRGLSYYYAQRFAEGAQQFELDLSVNSQDVEETVWRYLCLARLQGVEKARHSLLPVKNDRRLVMRWVYDLYADNCTPEQVLDVGHQEGQIGNFYSHLYLGLYYEAEGDSESSQHYINQAVSKYSLDDYMWYLAVVHKKLRGWS